MKRFRTGALILALALAGAASAKAQDVSQADKDRGLQYLESTKKGVLDATTGLSDAQWNFKSAPDRWSLAELMEQMKDMSADELQDQVHRRFEFKLCRPCQMRFLVNPLGKPRQVRTGRN